MLTSSSTRSKALLHLVLQVKAGGARKSRGMEGATVWRLSTVLCWSRSSLKREFAVPFQCVSRRTLTWDSVTTIVILVFCEISPLVLHLHSAKAEAVLERSHYLLSNMTDWYMDNLSLLVVVLVCSLVVFVLVFIVTSMRVRRTFVGAAAENRKSSDTPEVALIKAHTRMVRLLSVVGILLQAVLLVRITGLSSTSSTYSLALVRPVVNLYVFMLGFMTNTHAVCRVASMLLLGHIIVFDTVAEVSFAMVINCMQLQGLQCGDSALSLSLSDLELLKRRELASLFLSHWVALETAYLCVAVGFCSSRYSARRLSLSRPTFNLRAALLAHFPVHPASAIDKRPRFAV